MRTRRDFLGLLVVTAVGLCVAGPWWGRSSRAARADDSPNFLFILTDDQGWSQLSAPIHPDKPESASAYLNTPNMNRLAAGGMRFTSGYSPAPLCTPTRRSVLCGMTPARQKGTEFVSGFCPADHLTMPRALKRADPAYRCAHFGKWGSRMVSTPGESGYDSSDGETGNVTGGMENKQKEYHIVEDPKRTGSVTRRAVEFMREQADAGNPFYVQVSYYAVHLRVEVLEATLKKYRRRGLPDRGYTQAWAAMLEELDTAVGDLLKALDDMGIAGRTYVVFMADNGGRKTVPGGDAAALPTNYPLRGAKHSLYEGGVRVPFFVSGPGVPPGSVCHTPVAGYDLLPTFYDLAGGRSPLPGYIDGGSFAPLLAGPGKGKVTRSFDALIFHRPRKHMSTIRMGNDKLMIHWTAQGKIESRELFDLEADPYEQTDLSATARARADDLESKLLGYLRDVDARGPTDFRGGKGRKGRAAKRD